MRISDWSSDVCSSDLPAIAVRLRVNPVYERLLDAGTDPGSHALRNQAQKAHSLIKSVNQRFSTVLRVMQSIVVHQQAFFEQGMRGMRPLLLRDIAQELAMHASTVSRATRQKFVQTPWGVFEIKRFFGTALATQDGRSEELREGKECVSRFKFR